MKRNPKLQLSTYSAMAMALSIPVDGQVVYTNIEPDVVLDASDGITKISYLNMDGEPGFDFRFIANFDVDSSYGLGMFNLQVSPNYFNYGDGIAGAIYNSVYGSPLGMISQLEFGATIGPDNFFVDFDNASWYAYYLYGILGVNPSFPGVTNPWDGDADAHFMGVKVSIDGEQHYGWVRLSVNELSNVLTVLDYAIENTPGMPIVAGDGLMATCDAPEPIITGGIGLTAATAKWSAVPDALTYEFQYRVVGGDWNTATIDAPKTFKKMKGLDCNTNYDWQVRAICDGAASPYSPIQSFSTLVCREGEPNDVLNEAVIYSYNNQIYVQFDVLSEQPIKMIISDQLGHKVNECQLVDINNTILVNIPNGIYFISLISGEGQITQKIVVTN